MADRPVGYCAPKSMHGIPDMSVNPPLADTLFDPGTLAGAVVYAALIFGLAWLVVQLLRRSIDRLIKGQARLVNRTTLYFIAQLGRVVVFVLAIVLYANLIPALRAIGVALLASVSIASLVIGLAAQNTLGNLIAGISLALYRPFEVGDLVQVNSPGGPEIGHIESLTLGYTVLRTYDNRRVIIPNSVMGVQVTINLTARDPRKMAVIPFKIGSGVDVDQARSIMVELAQAHPLAQEVAGCPVVSLAGGGAVLSLRVWCRDFNAAQQVQFDLYESVKKAFDTRGIPLA